MRASPVPSWLKAAALTLPLTACQTADFNTACPPLVTYDAALQRRAAAELRALPAGAALATLVTDYGKTRDACRALEERR